jgi:hypothetical protein
MSKNIYNFAANYGKSANFSYFGPPTATAVTPDGVSGRERSLPQAD